MEPTTPKVLLVEDDPSIRFTLEAMLRRLKVDVVSACDGREALDRVDEIAPDLILLDLMMPKLNGYQFLRAFRRQDDRDTPVIIVSVKKDPIDRYWAGKLGVDAYVQKPFTFEEISRAIGDSLAKRPELAQLSG